MAQHGQSLKGYESLGFKSELFNPDYYEGEVFQIPGWALLPEEVPVTRPVIRKENPVIASRRVFEIGDADGAYTFE